MLLWHVYTPGNQLSRGMNDFDAFLQPQLQENRSMQRLSQLSLVFIAQEMKQNGAIIPPRRTNRSGIITCNRILATSTPSEPCQSEKQQKDETHQEWIVLTPVEERPKVE
jgi:hypothetical protein